MKIGYLFDKEVEQTVGEGVKRVAVNRTLTKVLSEKQKELSLSV